MDDRFEVHRERVDDEVFEVALWLVRDERRGLRTRTTRIRRIVARRFANHASPFVVERFDGELAEVAEYARRGEWGCFMKVSRSAADALDVKVYERWFDGAEVQTELLAEHHVQLDGTRSLDLPNELAGDLKGWMARRDDEREIALVDAEAGREAADADDLDREHRMRDLAALFARAR